MPRRAEPLAGASPVVRRIAGRACRYYRITMPTLTFKVSPREAARIRRLARREGRTLSEFLRRRATEPEPAPAAMARDAYHIEISAVTGLPVLRAPGDVSVVTSDQIREIAADFP